jgi:hypothetical protein
MSSLDAIRSRLANVIVKSMVDEERYEAARMDVVHLLAVAEAAKAYHDYHNSDGLDQDPFTERMKAALAALEEK